MRERIGYDPWDLQTLRSRHESQGHTPIDDPGWQQKQIAAAQPVTAEHASFRSDQLLDTAVRSTKDEALGSIQDLVMSPKTGKIAYLVVARGGFSGSTRNMFRSRGMTSKQRRT